jgi:hypothetical protein
MELGHNSSAFYASRTAEGMNLSSNATENEQRFAY